MASESKHISEWIDRAANAVYGYASDPANLPQWAPGLGSCVEQVDGRWFVETTMGRVGLDFAPHNDYGTSDEDYARDAAAVAADLASLKALLEERA
jgi:hypothetical protein